MSSVSSRLSYIYLIKMVLFFSSLFSNCRVALGTVTFWPGRMPIWNIEVARHLSSFFLNIFIYSFRFLRKSNCIFSCHGNQFSPEVRMFAPAGADRSASYSSIVLFRPTGCMAPVWERRCRRLASIRESTKTKVETIVNYFFLRRCSGQKWN